MFARIANYIAYVFVLSAIVGISPLYYMYAIVRNEILLIIAKFNVCKSSFSEMDRIHIYLENLKKSYIQLALLAKNLTS